MKPLRPIALALLLGLAFTLPATGCGDSPDEADAEALLEYVAAVQAFDNTPEFKEMLEQYGSSSEDFDPSDSSTWGEYVKAQRLLGEALDRYRATLEEIDPPPTLAEAHAGLIDSCEIGATLLAKSVEHLQTGDVAYLQSPDAETQALMEQMKANSQTFVKALQAQADRLEVKLPYPLNLPFDQRAGVDEPSSPDEEIDRLKEQLRASPGDSATLLALGEAFQQQGAGEEDGSERQVMAFAASAGYYEQYAATLQESTEATDKQRKLDVLSTLAGLYANLQQYDKLVSVYGRITELRPSDADNYLYYGQAAQNAGRNDIAIMAYRKFLMLAPNSTYANDVKEILDELVGAASPDSGEGP